MCFPSSELGAALLFTQLAALNTSDGGTAGRDGMRVPRRTGEVRKVEILPNSMRESNPSASGCDANYDGGMSLSGSGNSGFWQVCRQKKRAQENSRVERVAG